MTQQQSVYDGYEQQYQLIDSSQRITSILRPLIDEHSLLRITLKNSGEIFSSILLATNPDEGELSLDSLHPEQGNITLSQSKHAMVEARVNGIDVKFDIALKESHVDGSLINHIFAFPETIRYRQRRDSYRAQVSPTYDLGVKLQTEDGKQCSGLLDDISDGGISIQFSIKKPLPEIFLDNETRCSISLPDGNRIRCRFQVTHTGTHEITNVFQVGGRFIDLDKTQRRAVERFTAKLQRERQQNNTR